MRMVSSKTGLCAFFLAVIAHSATGRAQSAQDPDGLEKERAELQQIDQSLAQSGFEQRRLQAEMTTLSEEAQTLRAQVLEVAARLREAETRAQLQRRHVEESAAREQEARGKLQAREHVLASVLAAMQRIGAKPPPALLAAPEDVLKAMRSAVLMGAVLPPLRDEALALIGTLQTLVALKQAQQVALAKLEDDERQIREQRAQLEYLLATRQAKAKQSEGELSQNRARAGILARQAEDLRDLITRSEADSEGARKAADLARQVPEAPAAGSAGSPGKLSPGNTTQIARLQPREPFGARRGQALLPITGDIVRSFGVADSTGAPEKGMTLLGATHALVSAPADGWVQFSGPYLSYGHLLVLNVGNGYHMVLAGMGRVSVEAGQFVLSGEPLGFLPEKSLNEKNISSNAPAPLGVGRAGLYVEIRKEGQPVNPAPFFGPGSEKARG